MKPLADAIEERARDLAVDIRRFADSPSRENLLNARDAISTLRGLLLEASLTMNDTMRAL